jgi:PPM family protein phosphatase
MLRVAEQAHRTDTGRQRTANEDAYFARAPLFAVADGMGGAQAGEVASRIAAEAFQPSMRGDDEPPESYLRSIAKTANARINRLANADSSRSGMGTTLTAALVEDDEVSFAHVGDSRAYVYRDGNLKLLTSDHSLVEELRRQGRLTDEQAQDHPQRSIITRALGPEADVDVDTMTYRARPGDVYLLCSDGLTTMVTERRIAEVLDSTPGLDDAVSQLVEEANEAGGRDNITVVAFRLEEAEVAAAVEEGATLVGPTAEEAGLSREAVAAATARAEAERAALGGAAAAPARRRVWPRRLAKGIAVLAVLGALVGGAVYGLHHVYFLGSDSGGRLALYRGVPYELPLGIDLYSEIYAAPIQVSSIPAERRDSATDHTLRGHDDAVSLIESLQADAETAAKPPGDGARQRARGGAGGGRKARERSGGNAGRSGGGAG